MLVATVEISAQRWLNVDPRIGSVGVGRTFPGPSMPFGMVKPGPDCGVLPNAGWAPMPEPVLGFSQTHVSGTGGGQKYGNILIQPYLGSDRTDYAQQRVSEKIELGYYATDYADGICTEITTSERCAHYRIHYPQGTQPSLLVDATHFLGKDTVPDLRERQQFVGAEVEAISSHELRGFSRIRGGWNNGDAYTVYFCLTTDRPFTIHQQPSHLHFTDTLVNVKIGISYVSTQQAKRNIDSIGFDQQLERLRYAWEEQLCKIRVEGTPQQQRMFYTALYHTMLMPVDKTGENPKWTDKPYYDDYYAIWDTYRTSTPLITLLDPQRQAAIVRSMLNIYRREGYLPDARSGDCNGRTQGGSNAEVVIADVLAKDVGPIDYELALEAMLKDGEADPGADHEKHGRGGLREYIQLGYIPYGVPRAGTRTLEYAYDDYCIALVAQRLGRNDIYERYLQRSHNWRNLWRSDFEYDGMKGFILPRDEQGRWLDSVPWGRSQVFHPLIPYTPVTKVAPWYLPWWDTFFYEATSQEYSLSVPHDVEGLIQVCGGTDAFRQRLDRFFEQGYYNVQNEPSFLTPCLYHWIGRPDLSSQRIHSIIRQHYNDQPDGLPGNDDSGAMSSWLAFHMMGIYPNAGQDYYLLNVPLLPEYTLSLSNGKTLHVVRQGRGDGFLRVSLNGQVLSDARITHQQLMQGGQLLFETKTTAAHPSSLTAYPSSSGSHPSSSITQPSFLIHFTLNRQFRSWPLAFTNDGDTLSIVCKQTTYRIPLSQVEHAESFCWLSPQNDGTMYHDVRGTFAFVSADAVRMIQSQGKMIYDGITWRRQDDSTPALLHLKADIDRTEMWLQQKEGLWLVTRMQGNPLGIDWNITGN